MGASHQVVLVARSMSSGVLRLKGTSQFRQSIACATLTGRTVIIDDIRTDDEEPGLRDFEASFLRLMEKVTNGCGIKINETGTKVNYKPGILVGGTGHVHDCGKTRSIGYFVEALIPLALFCKEPLAITFIGITNNDCDLSVDTIRTVTLPLLRHFGVEDGLEFKIKKRGAPPEGGGEVLLKCPVVKELKPINLIVDSKVRRIRGIAYSAGVSAQMSNRLVDAAKAILTQFTGDAYIYTDHHTGYSAGKSPGFGLSLVAETAKGCHLSAEGVGSKGVVPEDVGKSTALLLCEEVLKGGCVDTAHQSFAFLMMVLCPEDVGKIRIGKLSAHSVRFLQHLRLFFGITFKIVPDVETRTVLLSCRGIGFKNTSRRTS